MTAPLISVVMGCYNQKEVLSLVLPEYAHQTLAKALFEVIVVDSSSNDGTSEWLTDLKPDFNFVPIIKPNTGKASARNTGVAHARGRWIIICDADMIPDPQFVQTHLEAHQHTSVPSCFEGLAWNMSALNWPPIRQQLTPQVGTHPKNMAKLGWYYFLTGNLSFPKILFMDFNGFDTAFTGYGWEDLELGYRFSKAGVPLRYLHNAINYHYHVVLPEDELPRCEDKGKSARYMLSKHPELKLFLGLNPFSVWTFPRFKKEGDFYIKMTQWLQKDGTYYKKFALWFLKEYHYLRGLIPDANWQ